MSATLYVNAANVESLSSDCFRLKQVKRRMKQFFKKEGIRVRVTKKVAVEAMTLMIARWGAEVHERELVPVAFVLDLPPERVTQPAESRAWTLRNIRARDSRYVIIVCESAQQQVSARLHGDVYQLQLI